MAAKDATLELGLARDLMEGKPEAFDRFVGYFRPRIFSYAQMICGSREDAEEVTQDALMKAFSSFDQLREPERVKAWVLRIARNGRLMKRRRSAPVPTEELSLDDFLRAPIRMEGGGWKWRTGRRCPRPGPARRAARIGARYRGITGDYRSVIFLRDIEEVSMEEAARGWISGRKR